MKEGNKNSIFSSSWINSSCIREQHLLIIFCDAELLLRVTKAPKSFPYPWKKGKFFNPRERKQQQSRKVFHPRTTVWPSAADWGFNDMTADFSSLSGKVCHNSSFHSLFSGRWRILETKSPNIIPYLLSLQLRNTLWGPIFILVVNVWCWYESFFSFLWLLPEKEKKKRKHPEIERSPFGEMTRFSSLNKKSSFTYLDTWQDEISLLRLLLLFPHEFVTFHRPCRTLTVHTLT